MPSTVPRYLDTPCASSAAQNASLEIVLPFSRYSQLCAPSCCALEQSARVIAPPDLPPRSDLGFEDAVLLLCFVLRSLAAVLAVLLCSIRTFTFIP
jgi:hypothetical protein